MMAVSNQNTRLVEAQTVDTTDNSAAAPRKRRRRAPATGATEDCFSCKKRNVKCDRRRPYCGQCVDMGKECSGYRTTLTWGVGVASRGKLRGLSLPVVKAPAAVIKEHKQQRTNTVVSTYTPSTCSTQRDQSTFNSRAAIDFGAPSPPSPVSPAPFSAPQDYQYFGSTSPIAIPPPSPHTHTSFPMQQHDFLHPHSKQREHSIHRGSLQRPPQRLQTTLHVPYEECRMSASSASLGTYSDSDFPSPSEHPQTPIEEFLFADPLIPRYAYHSHDQPMNSYDNFFFNDAPKSLPSPDDMSSSVSSEQSVQDYAELDQQAMGAASFPDIFIEGEMSSSFPGFQLNLPFLPSEDSYNRFAPFPADAVPSGVLRQMYMPGTGGF